MGNKHDYYKYILSVERLRNLTDEEISFKQEYEREMLCK